MYSFVELQVDQQCHVPNVMWLHCPDRLPICRSAGRTSRGGLHLLWLCCGFLFALQVVPVFNYRRVDLLIRVWDVRQGQLEAARFRLAQAGKRPTRKTKCCGGEQVSQHQVNICECSGAF
jgi:hypothetical protein